MWKKRIILNVIHTLLYNKYVTQNSDLKNNKDMMKIIFWINFKDIMKIRLTT